MMEYNYLEDTLFHQEVKPRIGLGKIGIEKESFRFANSEISRSPHPKTLGSALCNKFITTDFSESLLEFVTDPFESNNNTLEFLENIHLFVLDKLKDELLWPFSIPPYIKSEADIGIAEYGSSNIAKLKMIYRNGLSNRYGRVMQGISGIHFNYSLDPEMIKIIIDRERSKNNKISKSDIYFRMIRNLTRFNWLIIYLFGASPAINRNFLGENKSKYKKIKDMFVMEHSTSLRMSDIGYYVADQQQLDISTKNLNRYLESLKKYTTLPNPKFNKIEENTNKYQSQISDAFLQIEDEYYSNIRPKSSLLSGERMTSKLGKTGVDYIELRTLDVNPFKKAGIGMDDLKFLEAFMLFSTFLDSPEMTFGEVKLCRENDLHVSINGRKQNLKLHNGEQRVLLKEWGLEILNLMQPIFDLLSLDYSLIRKYKMRINDIDKTPSARLIKLIENHNGNYSDLAIKIASKHKDEYQQKTKKNNQIQALLSGEVERSFKEQKELESSSFESFNEYLSKYMYN